MTRTLFLISVGLPAEVTAGGRTARLILGLLHRQIGEHPGIVATFDPGIAWEGDKDTRLIITTTTHIHSTVHTYEHVPTKSCRQLAGKSPARTRLDFRTPLRQADDPLAQEGSAFSLILTSLRRPTWVRGCPAGPGVPVQPRPPSCPSYQWENTTYIV